MRTLKIARSTKLPRLATLFAAVACLGLAGCDDHAGDPKMQIGANPPAAGNAAVFDAADAGGEGRRMGKDETPTVAQGLQVHALATGFEHPRSLYVLPNGDVLVVESNGPKAPIYRPKDIITGWVQSVRRRQGKGRKPHHAAARTNGDGVPMLRTVFLDHSIRPLASR